MLHKHFIPGFPNISTDHLTKYAKKIELNTIEFTSIDHTNIEIFKGVLQLTPDSPPTLVSEFFPLNLDTFIAQNKCAICKQLELCHDMAKGLQYLHSVNIIHYNLHGRNILIGSDGSAKIADYVCPQVITAVSSTASINVAYLPPEVIEDRSNYTAQSDIYSIGVLFLQVITQKIPALTNKTERAKLRKRKEELSGATGHLLRPTILQCLNTIVFSRPLIENVCQAVADAKKAPQSVMSAASHGIVSDCLCCVKLHVSCTSWKCS